MLWMIGQLSWTGFAYDYVDPVLLYFHNDILGCRGLPGPFAQRGGSATDVKAMFANSLLRLTEERSFDDITVLDIVRESGLSRSTFYNHFIDKFDLANWIHRGIQQRSLFDPMAEGKTFEECAISSIESFEPYLHFYRTAFNQDFIYSLRRSLLEMSIEFMTAFIGRAGNDVDDPATQMTVRIYCAGCAANTIDWIMGKVDLTAQEYAQCVVKAIPQALAELVHGVVVGEQRRDANYG